MTRFHYLISVIAVSISLCFGCNNSTIQATHLGETLSVNPFRISSPAFNNGGSIPEVYTCDSTNISPALHWNNPFTNTASFALIMDDPDAPEQTWVHWIMYNIPVSDTSLAMHFSMDSVLTNGTKQGFTSFRTTGYGGPCPPEGIHRYYFKLYALDVKLNVVARLTKLQLINAMNGHILAQADLMGIYSRKKNEP